MFHQLSIRMRDWNQSGSLHLLSLRPPLLLLVEVTVVSVRAAEEKVRLPVEVRVLRVHISELNRDQVLDHVVCPGQSNSQQLSHNLDDAFVHFGEPEHLLLNLCPAMLDYPLHLFVD
jgi:hypothetical protein